MAPVEHSVNSSSHCSLKYHPSSVIKGKDIAKLSILIQDPTARIYTSCKFNGLTSQLCFAYEPSHSLQGNLLNI